MVPPCTYVPFTNVHVYLGSKRTAEHQGGVKDDRGQYGQYGKYGKAKGSTYSKSKGDLTLFSDIIRICEQGIQYRYDTTLFNCCDCCKQWRIRRLTHQKNLGFCPSKRVQPHE